MNVTDTAAESKGLGAEAVTGDGWTSGPFRDGTAAVTCDGSSSERIPEQADGLPAVTCDGCQQTITGDIYAYGIDNGVYPKILCANCADKCHPCRWANCPRCAAGQSFLCGWRYARKDRCRRCGRWRYRNVGWPHDYCTTECARAADLDRRRNIRRRDARIRASIRDSRSCQQCDATFIPSRSDARYCSPACRQRAYRQRKTS